MSLGQLYPDGTVPSAGIAHRRTSATAPGFDFTQPPARPTPAPACHVPPTARSPAPAPRCTPSGSTDGVYQLPGNTGYYGADANGSAVVGALAGVGALQRSTRGCGPPASWSTTPPAIADPDIDYSDYDTDKDGVVDFFMAVFAGCGGNGASQLRSPCCDYTDRALRQRLAALLVAGVLLHRPGDRAARLHHRRPAQGPRGPAALVHRRQLPGHDDRRPRRRAQGVRPGRPLQRQPRDRDRQGERHLPRVRPLARPARLLLHRQPRDLRRLEPDGDRQVAEHGRLLPPGARLGGARRCSSRARHPTVDGLDGLQAGHRHHHLATPDGTPYTLERRHGRPRAELRRCTSPSCPAGSCSTRRSSTPATRPARPTRGGRGSGNDFGCAPTAGTTSTCSIPELADCPGQHGEAATSSRSGTSSGTSTTATS